ncbi:hypothetical protein D770_04755 [Flammeovirgaceae bacterium 311]|nr:hypothetical protein D770_04755 [Flammeovirgaceae bacterium 311]
MEKITKPIFLLLILIIAAACDPEATYIYEIDNKSSYTIDVHFKYPRGESVVIESLPDSTTTIRIYETISSANDKGDNFLYIFDTIYLDIPAPYEVKKDIQLRNNWVYRWKDANRWFDVGDGIYTIIIEDGDIGQ